jgi:hypothetical protein
VDVGLSLDGHVEVEDVGDVIDIEAAGSDIGSDQDAGAAGLEAVEGLAALVLGLVAVDGLGDDTGTRELLADLVRAVLGAGEDQGASDFRSGDLRLARRRASRSDCLELRSIMKTPCSISGAAEETGVTETRTGSRKSDAAKCWIALGIVAEKRSV